MTGPSLTQEGRPPAASLSAQTGRALRVMRLVAAKELRESLRDRRTLAVTILFPLFVYPLITLLLSQVSLHRQQRSEGQPVRVALLGPPALVPDVTAALIKTTADEKPMRLAKGDERALKAGAVDVIVSFAARNDAAKDGAIHADLLYDETREESVRAKEIVETRLERAPTGCPARFQIDARSVAAQRDVGGYLLAKGLPVFVVMMVMLGAFYPAIDTTAGERERQTLESLLVAPVPPRWLLGGKLAAVTAIAAIAGLLHVSSIALTLGQALRMAGFSGFVVPWARLVGVLALIPLAALTFSALLMAVASFGRTSREAQSFVTPVYLLGLIPSLLVGAGEWPLTPALGALPIANLTLAARALLSGRWTAAALGTVAATTAVYAALAVLWAERSFRPALWLARDGAPRESKSEARRPRGTSSGRQAHPASPTATLPVTPAQSLGLFAMAFVVLYFVAVPLQRRELISGLLISEWLGIAGLTAAFLRLSRHPFAFTTRLRWPGGKALLGAALVGASAWLLVGLLTQWLIPVPKEVVESLRRAIRPDDHSRSLAFSLFLMALTPAVCEELLFRGALLRGFLPLGRWPALLLTGALFGLFHVDVWRLFPTALLGVVLSWLAFRADSLWASMLAHFINNGALVALAHLGVDEAPEKAGAPLQAVAFTAALVVCGVGLFLVESDGRRRDGRRDAPQMGGA